MLGIFASMLTDILISWLDDLLMRGKLAEGVEVIEVAILDDAPSVGGSCTDARKQFCGAPCS